MCGRYGFVPGEDFYPRYNITNRLETLSASYNVAPGYSMPVVVRENPNLVYLMRWGLIPFWAKDIKIGYKMINARAETVEEKSAFRKPFESRRCLIPASGFYEWKKTGNEKIPFYIKRKDNGLFSFAGLYDVWTDVEGKEIKSYTIITTKPNKLIESIHNRMPVILKKEEENHWIDSINQNIEKIKELLAPYPDGEFEAYPVTRAVNNPENDSPDLIKPGKPGWQPQKNYSNSKNIIT
ncbi:hypothetical protein A3D05_03400 [Candidatus Gottesmanbacteria bacterium RIFCSPHIGHO2_02_FULL_40_24]|uniref:Abasic site processing protein n=1 Tax=Candidatus Gottesmanbacteria bacterium RIFCSPHIGHO2_01_FULL_40_15 TaxID=1798376 RepID=A0A1F5Z1J2_9BACT|nr:MAG: hypothetical protein A2777_02525 [Candidatus Gottesmanbacteria bacterium RIFCSPHIGHO2_01_FULL_40_15]OGG17879.1 MAG: hypothetical protein A3D05_03400 [Candidatus Gottesmanbacteria bacterium RIFCSPHIGHO2_02_FULL_40_24]OGG21746.1 MAG: hypothetical protein A3B48_03550 [Candidatus Gottesmanbacteria bacterium RIFCSPLOWO2_01_FULL_40_10]OGG24720.1 MAG: hypothetical protein A3E42_01580 [Candidatus Gottesmanbacteria bacterium RIFCSPHIGHO2_12_FULL_40_13]OGG31998.1 MAG: hypothetical protein A3I80_0